MGGEVKPEVPGAPGVKGVPGDEGLSGAGLEMRAWRVRLRVGGEK